MFQEENIPLHLPDSEIIYYPNFFNVTDAIQHYKTLLESIDWQQDDITVYGKTYAQPRLTALFANNNKTYSYSNINMHPELFSETL